MGAAVDDLFTWVRWIFGGLIAVIASLLVLAWRGLGIRVDVVNAVGNANTAVSVLHAERITRMEERMLTHMDADDKMMQHIDKRLDRIEAKLDRVPLT